MSREFAGDFSLASSSRVQCKQCSKPLLKKVKPGIMLKSYFAHDVCHLDPCIFRTTKFSLLTNSTATSCKFPHFSAGWLGTFLLHYVGYPTVKMDVTRLLFLPFRVPVYTQGKRQERKGGVARSRREGTSRYANWLCDWHGI